MARIVLGVSGSVAAYRAADLARDLMRGGHEVRACLTDAASRFVSPALFEALTGQPCLQDVFEEPERGRMAHIDWARAADLLVVAPATANTMNKIAFGQGEDMLTTIALAYEGPLVVAPAMNPSMYANPVTQEAVERLRARAAILVEPEDGDVACGEYGQGKLAPNARILGAVESLLDVRRLLAGRKVVITSGPTQEPIDDVRYLSNRSSGRMGAALARAALLMRAAVTVVSGPSSVPMPRGVSVVRVRTADEMLAATLEAAADADLVVGAAAVADYRPATRVSGKLRRSSEPLTLDLVPNPDVIARVAAETRAKVVGFAAEPGPDPEVAAEKLRKKGLAAIAANDVSRSDVGFEGDENELVLIRADGSTENSGKMSKLRCAFWLLEHIAP